MCQVLGRRYWPTVTMSTSFARRSRIVARISSLVSPRPSIIDDFENRSDRSLQALDGLDVVVEDIDGRIDDGAHRVEVSLEIRDERLDEHVRTPDLDFSNRLREVRRAAVCKVVPVHGGQDDV